MELISLVIPVFFEEENIKACYSRVKTALQSLPFQKQEIIFVDDGSKDRTLPLLKEIVNIDSSVKIISFSRNFGHQTAVTAGLKRCRGDVVVILDADLQDPPEFISTMLTKWREGYKVVYAVRTKRKENIAKRLAYAGFYRILQRLSDIPIPLDTGDFCLMDKVVVQHLNSMPERNRFVRGLRSWVGFRQVGIPYERDRRRAGEVKYTLPKLIKLAIDGLFSFSQFPLRLTTLFGLIVSSLSFVGGLIAVVLKYTDIYTPRGWTSTLVIVFFLGGIQLIAIGIIGEYVGRIYDEVKQRPQYVVEEEINF
ncbi:MAG: glycosyltransferase family 2 protein [Cyclobacteriaceae bacterium]|nr:glycosyltransferase family 2 protein [Cyclobacteriaceae bacterium]